MTEPTPAPTVATVEALVRQQMSTALGGRRGMLEAAVPGLAFTFVWLPTKDLTLALTVSLVLAGIELAVRLVQRSTLQFVLNAVFSIAIGYAFVRIAASSGGSEDEQALAFFLPGILYSLAYTILLVGSCVARWPAVGFMLGSVTGDPTAWHADKQVVRLCSRLTLLLAAPGAVGVALQGPVWVLGWQGAIGTGTAVAIIAGLRYGLGWPLRIASWSAMVWLLARNATPLEPAEDPDGQRGLTA
ncbi:DUF3159 domain-containing protein [Nocardioides litoris]|uniref:DUF3159 domain-containing protein n=1 Tax=Nocardioides litoris TaxID=1926648 RepID=UPI00111FB770|nr:DUF3159 domain-containing protein [Nocardioides litoris]